MFCCSFSAAVTKKSLRLHCLHIQTENTINNIKTKVIVILSDFLMTDVLLLKWLKYIFQFCQFLLVAEKVRKQCSPLLPPQSYSKDAHFIFLYYHKKHMVDNCSAMSDTTPCRFKKLVMRNQQEWHQWHLCRVKYCEKCVVNLLLLQ